MVYSNNKESRQVSFITKLKIKFGKKLAKSFPHNKIRILGLRICGYTVGKDVYIGEDLIIASMISEKTCNLTIGDRVAIGPRTTLILSSDANWSNLMLTIKPIRGEIILEKDCWIGAGAIILPNITIGESAIVGAGAVVTKDVNASEIVVGVPAKKIKS
jgi:acetyltransferase-like isoleucine patch superfamily enzyme